MKRLGALLLVLVLTLSVMPMGALAAYDSDVFLITDSNDDLASLSVAAANATWSVASPGTPYTYEHLAIVDNATIDRAVTVDYLIIDDGIELTITNGGAVTVNKGLVFASYTSVPGTIALDEGGRLLLKGTGFNNTSFETQDGGKITLKIPTAVSTSNATKTTAAIKAGSPTGALISRLAKDFDIEVTGAAATISNYVQTDDSQLTVTNVPVTFMGNNTLGGLVNVASAVNVNGTVILSPATYTAFGVNPAGGEVTVSGRLDIAKDFTKDAVGKYIIDGGTMNVNASATFASAVDIKANGTVNIATKTTFGNAVTINPGGTLTLNEETEFTTNPTINGTLNIDAAPTFAGTDIEVDNSGVLNVGVDFTLGGSNDLIVNAGGTLKVNDGVTLDLGGKNLTITGVADFGTGGKLKDTTDGGVVTITGALYMKDPAVQVFASVSAADFRGNGTIYTDHRTWFIRGYADPDLKYVGYSPLAISYGESILVNTPVLAPATSNYSGYGDFIINTSGLFSNFDPNESLYANNQKLQVGVDYEVNDKGGYAIFTIYESFMQSQSGPIVFRATFKNGYSGSTTVNAQSATIPAEIGVDAPKTGMSASVMGFVVIAMAIALAVVVRKVKA